MTTEKYITIPRLAEILGVSRIAVYQRVKKGHIPAVKVGKTYVITDKTVTEILGKRTSKKVKARIDAVVGRTMQEYGELLRKLGRE